MASSIAAGAAGGGPTTGAERLEGTSRWAAHPHLALATRVLALLVPLAAAVVVAWGVGGRLPRPANWVGFAARWLAMSAVATGVVLVVERGTRRLLPLAALLDLSLVFPDRAPSRFRVALRANGARQLEKRTERDEIDGGMHDATEAASQILAHVFALQAHDRRTRGHCERVRAYAFLIGQELKLDDDELDRLQWAALLHDIGKMEVPAEILNKNGKPTDEEWEVLARHPEAGVRLVAPLVPFLGEWVRAVGEHHERWEGGGYPSGVSGHEISLSARIVAVADSFEVMTAPRSYKPALSIAAARTELTRCAGAQFDPTVVRAFLNISLGRIHRVIGPIAWLLQLPFVPPAATLPLPSAAAAAGVVAAATLIAPNVAIGPERASAGATSSVPFVSASEEERDGTTSARASEAASPSSTPTTQAGDYPSVGPVQVPGAPGGPVQVPEAPGGAGETARGPGGPATAGGVAGGGDAPVIVLPAAPGPAIWYLGTSGPGNTASTSVLPLVANPPAVGALANYDTDRDAFPGLLVQKTNHGLGETDLQKRQLWSVPGGMTLRGVAHLQIWAAMKDFKTDKQAHLLVAIQDCHGSMTGCSTIASGTGFVDGTTGPGWKSVGVPLGTVNVTIGAGRHLVVRVQVEDYSDDDCWLAYGTAGMPAALTVG